MSQSETVIVTADYERAAALRCQVRIPRDAGIKLLSKATAERVPVLASGIADDTKVDVSRVLGLGVVVHRSL